MSFLAVSKNPQRCMFSYFEKPAEPMPRGFPLINDSAVLFLIWIYRIRVVLLPRRLTPAFSARGADTPLP